MTQEQIILALIPLAGNVIMLYVLRPLSHLSETMTEIKTAMIGLSHRVDALERVGNVPKRPAEGKVATVTFNTDGKTVDELSVTFRDVWDLTGVPSVERFRPKIVRRNTL